MQTVKGLLEDSFSLLDHYRRHLVYFSFLLFTAVFFCLFWHFVKDFPVCGDKMDFAGQGQEYWDDSQFGGVPLLPGNHKILIPWFDSFIYKLNSFFPWRIIYTFGGSLGIYLLLAGFTLEPVFAFFGSFLFIILVFSSGIINTSNSAEFAAFMYFPLVLWSLNYHRRKADLLSMSVLAMILISLFRTGYLGMTLILLLLFFLHFIFIFFYKNYPTAKKLSYFGFFFIALIISCTAVSYPINYKLEYLKHVHLLSTESMLKSWLITPIMFVLLSSSLFLIGKNKDEYNRLLFYTVLVISLFFIMVLGIYHTLEEKFPLFTSSEAIYYSCFVFLLLLSIKTFQFMANNRNFSKRKNLLYLPVLIMIMLVIIYFMNKFLHIDLSPVLPLKDPLIVSLINLSVYILALYLFYLKKILKPALIMILIVILLITTLFPEKNKEEGEEKTKHNYNKIIELLGKVEDEARIFIINEESYKVSGFNTISGIYPVVTKRFYDISANCLTFPTELDGPINWNIINMYNGKYIISDRIMNYDHLQFLNYDIASRKALSINTNAKSNFWFADTAIVVTQEKTRYRRLNSFDFNPEAVFVEEPIVFSGKPDTIDTYIAEWTNRSINMDMFINKSGLLVISKNHFPPLWSALVDNKETKIIFVNHSLMGILIPAGKHNLIIKNEVKGESKYLFLSRLALLMSIASFVAGSIMYFRNNYKGLRLYYLKK